MHTLVKIAKAFKFSAKKSLSQAHSCQDFFLKKEAYYMKLDAILLFILGTLVIQEKAFTYTTLMSFLDAWIDE